jgi:hypothetical protein
MAKTARGELKESKRPLPQNLSEAFYKNRNLKGFKYSNDKCTPEQLEMAEFLNWLK